MSLITPSAEKIEATCEKAAGLAHGICNTLFCENEKSYMRQKVSHKTYPAHVPTFTLGQKDRENWH